ncbi:hypothetical protein KUTeg_003349 [Tegillarca granosa]|uniref:SAM domain-containing protein n=1 Tax=Tegillarca granosa TaxID=220873 RepID=A0ABQ9FLX5_TEGGR|nr:hypothetical protein KUTeg_003349 [Tegillarca granosa]
MHLVIPDNCKDRSRGKMPGPVERWLETFMCKQYADTFEVYGFKTLQSVCQLQLPQLQAMGVAQEHCEMILDNVHVLRQSLFGKCFRACRVVAVLTKWLEKYTFLKTHLTSSTCRRRRTSRTLRNSSGWLPTRVASPISVQNVTICFSHGGNSNSASAHPTDYGRHHQTSPHVQRN